MNDEHTAITGKRGEYMVMGKIMTEGLTAYIPVVDIEGIDCIVRNDKGRLIEIQIKTRNKNGEEDRQFNVKNLHPNKNFFIACYFIDTNELWIIPSYKFRELSIQKSDGHSCLVMNMNNQRALATYKDNLGLGLLKLGEMPELK